MDMKDNVLDASDLLNQRGEKIQLVISKADGLRSESRSYFDGVGFEIYNFRLKKLEKVLNGEG